MSACRIFRSPFFHSLRHSASTVAVRPEFLTSSSSLYVNPRQHVLGTDCITQTIPGSAIAGISDEKVLALFTGGFFGGFVFAFEWLLLTAGGGRILPVEFTGFPRDTYTTHAIWRHPDLSDYHLHPVGTCLVGSFMILDQHIASESEMDNTGQSASWVDYGFGSDKSSFAGCHRIQITRIAEKRRRDSFKPDTAMEDQVQIELQSFQCNPQKDVIFGPEIFRQFHYLYAKMLFANGMQSILSRQA
ncbi:uncharacterized protein BO97DRAFT_379458 [Aspergillus homomorphus CBS 101889]|uniref:Uncharacterized protein n=1 Tax=Aspergillus homomorphus (strain CBS 101889) TaxID=1450537 RepID=A0A395HHH7_ASPHC|nr:hypothetical protein BO97DRAFT_379458 [Aspergillus homomorphus CBS 101889]RAL06953.1 hypothetical protein BO97DRAFT_379458 [Aspergillus homomorphus CBS 101889]